MCLARVIGRKTLQEDTPCFGVVELTEDGDLSYYRSDKIVADEKGMIYADTECEIFATGFNITLNDNKYKSGFHRFLKLEDAEARKGSNDKQCAIRKYIIPKGTEITIGSENKKYVAVTPVLQFAKVNHTKKEDKKNVELLDMECEPITKI